MIQDAIADIIISHSVFKMKLTFFDFAIARGDEVMIPLCCRLKCCDFYRPMMTKIID